MKKIKIIFFSCFLYLLASNAFAGGPDRPYPPPSPPGNAYLFLRSGVSLSEANQNSTTAFPLVGGYIGLGSLWDVAYNWQIGAELWFNYIGCFDTATQTLNNNMFGPPVLAARQRIRDLLYSADALFLYKVTHWLYINTRVGIAILSRSTVSTAQQANAAQMVIVTTTTKTYTTLTGLLIGAGFKFRLCSPLFLTLDYDYVNISNLNLFQLGLEYNFAI